MNLLERQLRKKLILVCAPAGFGKTTLLCDFWHAQDGEDHLRIWVGLAFGDAEPARFVSAFIDACVEAGIDLSEAPDLLDQNSVAHSPENALAELARLLESQSQSILVFVDEYQNAASTKIDLLLKLFLHQTPSRVRIILAARMEPACGAAKLRLSGELAELSENDLAFNAAETREFFGENVLTQIGAENLLAKTRGWPAALRMAKLHIGESTEPTKSVASFSGVLPDVANYLEGELFLELPEDVKTFLSETSILPFLETDVANAVLLRHDGEQMLARVGNLNGLILPVGSQSRRLQHHPLFAEFLRNYLYTHKDTKHLVDLHCRAAEYFDRIGEYVFALNHAIEAADGRRIENILQRQENGLLSLTANISNFMLIMPQIDSACPNQVKEMLPSKAFYLMRLGDLKGARLVLNEIKKSLTGSKSRDGSRSSICMQVEYSLVEAIYMLYTDHRELADLIERLKSDRRRTEFASPMHQGVLTNALGIFQFRVGQIESANEAFDAAIDHFIEAKSDFGIIHNKLHLGMISVLKGEALSAQRHYEGAHQLQVKNLADDVHLSATVALSRAELLYETGDLKGAYARLPAARAAVVSRGDFWVELLSRAFRIEARLEFANRGLEAAFAILGQGIALAQKNKFERLEQSLVAQKIHIATAVNDLKLAESIALVPQFKLNSMEYGSLPRFGWREDAELAFALIRLEIARGRSPLALSALDKFDRSFHPKNLGWIELKSGTLRALALFANGQKPEAAALLRELIETGEDLDMRSFYLEEGLLAQDLLDEAAKRFSKTKRAEKFNQTVLEWLIASSSYLPPDKRLTAPSLTEQQLKILSFLAQGLDRNELAEQANTTTHNVQYHLKRMFDIFHVSSSMRLLAEATRLKFVNSVDPTAAQSLNSDEVVAFGNNINGKRPVPPLNQ